MTYIMWQSYLRENGRRVTSFRLIDGATKLKNGIIFIFVLMHKKNRSFIQYVFKDEGKIKVHKFDAI